MNRIIRGTEEMRCRLIALCALLLSVAFVSETPAASMSGDALQAMQTLQSTCEEGVTFEQYKAALDDTESQMGAFFESNETETNPEFYDKITRALIAYQSALVIWRGKIEYKQDFVRSDHPTMQMMLNVYPDAADLFRPSGQAHVRKLISFFWDKADSRIAEAKRLISGKRKR
jgi:hypothetical protein